MGQKVNPISFRLQVNKDWRSKWFAPSKQEYVDWLNQDLAVRKAIESKFSTRATIQKIDIERAPNLATITIHTAKAGVVIGRGGSGAQELKAQIEKIIGGPVRLNIEEVKRPELAAKLVAENIGRQLERRINWRRAVKMAAMNTMNAGAKGFVSKKAGFEELLAAIKTVYAGKKFISKETSKKLKNLNEFLEGIVDTLRGEKDFFSQREKEVLELLAKGYSTHRAAETLNLSPHTIHSHRKNIIKKLNIKSPTQYVLHAIDLGLIKT